MRKRATRGRRRSYTHPNLDAHETGRARSRSRDSRRGEPPEAVSGDETEYGAPYLHPFPLTKRVDSPIRAGKKTDQPTPDSGAYRRRGGGSRTAHYDFASVFAVPIVTNENPAEAPAATASVAQPTRFRSSVQETDPVEPTGPTAPVPTSPGSPPPQTMTPFSDRISTRTRRRSATAAGKAPPAVDYGFGPSWALQPSSRRVTTRPRARRTRPLLLPTRRPARYHSRPTTTTHSLWELRSYGLHVLLVTRRLHLQGRMPSTTLLNCGSRIPSCVIHMPIGSANNTQR